MLSKLRPRSIYDVMAAIACFVALAGGTAYAADTIGTSDIIDNQVFTTDVRDDNLGFGGLTHPDLGTGSVRSSEVLNQSLTGTDIAANAITSDEIVNGNLNDEDISQGRLVNFAVTIVPVSANRCLSQLVDIGIGALGDHLLLTPEGPSLLDFSVEYRPVGSPNDPFDLVLNVCNHNDFDVSSRTFRFNLLVIDAQ